jgi:hypothetical protein
VAYPSRLAAKGGEHLRVTLSLLWAMNAAQTFEYF